MRNCHDWEKVGRKILLHWVTLSEQQILNIWNVLEPNSFSLNQRNIENAQRRLRSTILQKSGYGKGYSLALSNNHFHTQALAFDCCRFLVAQRSIHGGAWFHSDGVHKVRILFTSCGRDRGLSNRAEIFFKYELRPPSVSSHKIATFPVFPHGLEVDPDADYFNNQDFPKVSPTFRKCSKWPIFLNPRGFWWLVWNPDPTFT